MSLVILPIMYVPDPVKGRPLFSGQIYAGTVDLDPQVQANQVQLYVVQEDGTSVPVQQPFLLSAGGVPVYNGSYVRLAVSQDNYSLKILDKQGAQVYYFDNAADDGSGGTGSITIERTFTLSDGQLVIDTGDLTASGASFYVGSRGGDRGRLFIGDDYTVTGVTEIQLTKSYPAGTICTAISDEYTGQDNLTVRNTPFGTTISNYENLVDGIHVMESVTGNVYMFSNANLSLEVSFDSLSGYYIPPSTDLTGASGAWILVSGSITADASVIVGSGEKHETINSLLAALENITSANKNSMEVTLKAGFVMAEQVLIYGSNLGWIKISSVDSEVVVSRSAMVLDLGSFDSSIPAFGGVSSTLPVINTAFRMDTSGSAIARQDGLFVENGNAIILPGAGFQDFTEVGIYANSGSDITAEGTNCSGSGVYGYFSFKASSVNCQSAIADNCGEYGLYINRASQGSANLARFNNAGVNAVRVIRASTLAWEDGVGIGSGSEGLYVLNSVAQCLRADVSNSGLAGVYSHDSSSVGFREGVAIACGGEATIWAFRHGNIDADSAILTGSLSSTAAVLAQRASNINIQDSDCSGSTATYGIRCSESSNTNAKDANAQKGASPAPEDCSVEFGGTIGFNGGTGGTDTSVNTITSKGIIFQ